MHRWAIVWIVTTLALAAGCSVQSTSRPAEGYYVMFDRLPELFDDAIYYGGAKVGTILSRATGKMGGAQMTITLEEGFAGKIGNAVVFYVTQGHLEVEPLLYGAGLLQKGTVLCGFASKTGLLWFKFKTLLTDRSSAAKARALTLKERFSGSS